MFITKQKIGVLIKKWENKNSDEQKAYLQKLLPKNLNDKAVRVAHIMLCKEIFEAIEEGSKTYKAIKLYLLEDVISSMDTSSTISINYKMEVDFSIHYVDGQYEYFPHPQSTFMHAAARVQDFELMMELLNKGG